VSWYSDLAEDETQPGWFSLELGVELDGKRVNLVPVLLGLLERSDELSSLRAIARGTDRFLAVPVEGHGYVRVEPQHLKRLLDVLVELYEKDGYDGKRLSFPEREAAAVKRLDEVFGHDHSVTWHGGEQTRSWVDSFFGTPPAVATEGLPVRATLRPYQLEGVAWLSHLAAHGVGGILADDMGLGKTLQTITHLAREHTGNALVPPSLIVCPKSLVGNWQRELSRFAPQLRVRLHHGRDRRARSHDLDGADIVITSYPILLRDEELFAELSFHVLVLDEAQAIKNASGSIHAAVKNLQATHRLCLSGTPIENHLGELWAQFDFLLPGFLGDEAQFRARYRTNVAQSLTDRARLDALHHRVAPYILRRTKESVAPELPPKIKTVVPIELSGKQRELYEAIRSAAHEDVRRAIRQKGFSGSALQVLDALMKLRQVCCDPRLVQMEAARFVRESAKLEKLEELLTTHLECKRRVLIFSQFTSMLSLIDRTLKQRDIDTLILTGQTENRQAKVDAFERGHADVFLISLKAGGTGLNLTSADTVIHYDPWWNPAAQDQATDRAYRIGQKRSVLVQELVVVSSVEERMRALQDQKRELSRAVLEGDGDGEASATLTERDVHDLFAPLEV
jgi:SNF2 family DNA or RNA helicase